MRAMSPTTDGDLEPKYIHLSTTDSIPMEPDRKVTNSMLTWVAGFDTVKEAEIALQEWARRNDYDGIVGISYLVVPNVSGTIASETARGSANEWADVAGTISTTFSYTAYGTAIRWG